VRKGLLIGVGNRYRGDDAAGCVVADRLLAGPHPGFDIVQSDGNVSGLLEWFRVYERILVFDATPCARGARLIRWNAVEAARPRAWPLASSHSMGVAEAIELARALGCLPRRLTVYGVPARQFGWQEGLSSLTARAVNRTVARIRREWWRDQTGAPGDTHAIRAQQSETRRKPPPAAARS